jgi:tRNA threonylcarbamoyladenosine biosynthesis protein TsaE
MRVELQADTAEDTRGIGGALSALLQAGDVVALTGDLGAGKTTFVQGVARGLGFDGPVASPTFTLIREYPARLRVYHADIYRLDRIQDVLDLGLDEVVDDDGVLLVEWGDAIEGLLPDDHLSVELTLTGEGESRRVVLSGTGRSWAARWERAEHAVERWGAVA